MGALVVNVLVLPSTGRYLRIWSYLLEQYLKEKFFLFSGFPLNLRIIQVFLTVLTRNYLSAFCCILKNTGFYVINIYTLIFNEYGNIRFVACVAYSLVPSICDIDRMKSVRFRDFFGPQFFVFGLNTKIYRISLRIQSKCGKIQTKRNYEFGHFSHSDTVQAIYSHSQSKWGKTLTRQNFSPLNILPTDDWSVHALLRRCKR